MAANDVKVLVDLSVRGRELVKGASSDLAQLDTTAKRASMGMGDLARGFATGTAVIAGAAIAAKQLYDVLRAGAVLQTTSQRFDKLSASIGTTADMMLGNLRTATKGMISDMELMASASQIMSLKLADNEDQVIRLATVAGTLGWDMQQVILTFANLSTMRLDALGLSVEEVKTKAAELEAAGMSAQQAFKEAVIQAGESRLGVGSVSESEQAFKQFETAVSNAKNELSLAAIQAAETAGAIDWLTAAVQNFSQWGVFNSLVQQFEELTGAAYQSTRSIKEMTPEGLAAEIEAVKGAIAGATLAINHQKLSADQSTVAMGLFGKTLADVTTAEAAFIMATYGVADAIVETSGAAVLSAQAADEALALWADVIERADAAAGVINAIRGVQTIKDFAAGMGKQPAADVRSYGSAIGYVNEQEAALAATHASMVQAFNAEASANIADGLIGADGLVNIEAANKALYEQAQAAGASAGELALLGVATGQLTDEQAKAALKAAILMERIKQLAAAVTSGDLSIGDAMGGLGDFRAQLDSGALSGAAGGIEGLAAAAEGFANGTYEATLDVNNAQANGMINETAALLGGITGTHYINLVTTSNAPTGGSGTGTGRAGAPITVNNTGGAFSDTASGRSGGSVYNVTVTNYVDGKQASHGSLDDITADKMAAALRGLGLGGR